MGSRGQGTGSRGGAYAPEHTRRVLLEAATALFDERGYHATSVESIVSAAGVTKGAFYHHFRGKEDVLLQIQDEYIENRLRNCQQIMATVDGAEQRLRALIYEALVGIEKYRAQVAIFNAERRFLTGPDFAPIKAKRDKVNACYEAVIQQGIDEGVFSSELNPRIVSFSILGMAAWALSWFRPGGKLSVRDVADQMSLLVLNGALQTD
jgi:TetR/AcrR family transcriptional regulator, cholesterol catabolism regulator